MSENQSPPETTENHTETDGQQDDVVYGIAAEPQNRADEVMMAFFEGVKSSQTALDQQRVLGGGVLDATAENYDALNAIDPILTSNDRAFHLTVNAADDGVRSVAAMTLMMSSQPLSGNRRHTTSVSIVTTCSDENGEKHPLAVLNDILTSMFAGQNLASLFGGKGDCNCKGSSSTLQDILGKVGNGIVDMENAGNASVGEVPPPPAPVVEQNPAPAESARKPFRNHVTSQNSLGVDGRIQEQLDHMWSQRDVPPHERTQFSHITSGNSLGVNENLREQLDNLWNKRDK